MGKFEILYRNIVSEEILALGDAVINPTNPMMRCGGGVSGAIFHKAGVNLLENYTERTFGISYFNPLGKNEMRVTETRITPGFNLKKDIIFAQGPKKWDYGFICIKLACFFKSSEQTSYSLLQSFRGDFYEFGILRILS